MADLFRFRLFFGRKKENLLFGYFYFTAEKVKFIFGRPLVQTVECDSPRIHEQT